MNNSADNPHIDIIFDGPPGPDGGRLVEIDDAAGQSIAIRTSFQRADGLWVLRITPAQIANPERVGDEDT
jgi:hypothetical protein